MGSARGAGESRSIFLPGVYLYFLLKKSTYTSERNDSFGFKKNVKLSVKSGGRGGNAQLLTGFLLQLLRVCVSSRGPCLAGLGATRPRFKGIPSLQALPPNPAAF